MEKREYLFDNREELTKYVSTFLMTAAGIAAQEVMKLTGVEDEDTVAKLYDTLGNVVINLADNVKCAMGEYHHLVETGEVKEDEKYSAKAFDEDGNEIPIEKLRETVMKQIELFEGDNNDNDND